MARRRIRTPQELARVHQGWMGNGEGVSPRAAPRAATQRRVYTMMSKYQDATSFDLDAHLWIEDSTMTGQEAGQYRVTVGDFYQPLVNTFTYAAYGGLSMSAPQTGFWNDIGATYQTIDVFDAQPVTTQRGIVSDVANNTFAIEVAGVYWYSLNLTFEHDNSNQGRLTYVRFWDTTDDQPLGPSLVVSTGRNAEATSAALSGLFEQLPEDNNHPMRIEIGGGDSYTAVSFDNAEFSIMGAGEYRGPDLSA